MCGKKTIKKEIEKTIKVEVDESLHEKVDESLHEKVDESVHEKVKIENIKMENVSDEEELSDDAIFECLKNDCECQPNIFHQSVFSTCWY